MKDKLLALMKNEGLKPSQLAEMLEINPAGISHILAGRNKPGFDLLQKILRRFPRINPDWLMLDSEVMYRDNLPMADGFFPIAPGEATNVQANNSQTAGTSGQAGGATDIGAIGSQTSGATNSAAGAQTIGVASGTIGAQQNRTAENVSGRHGASTAMGIAAQRAGVNVQRIVVLYEDQTFESYTPNLN